MALIKGNKIDQGGLVVVQGDQVIVEDEAARKRAGRRPETVEVGGSGRASAPVERVVPAAIPGIEVVPAELSGGPATPPAGDLTPPAEAALQAQIAAGAPPEAGGVAEPASAGAAGEIPGGGASGGDPLAGWDAARQEVLDQAQQTAQEAAEEAMGGVPSPADVYGELLEGATERLTEALGAEAQAALEEVVPSLESLAAAKAEQEAVRAAERARWREIAGAEEQIAALLDNFDITGPTAQMLLAERERILSEARLEAERLMSEAQQAAAAARADAQAQIAQAFEDFEVTKKERYEQLVEQARAAGYTEGRAQADEEGAKILEEAIETLNRARLAYPKAVRDNSQKLIELAMTVAEKIVCEEIAAKPETVIKVLDEALTRVTDMESVVVRVNTEDLPIVQEQEDRYRDMMAQVKKLDFQGSNKIQRGGVFIETGSGTVDATIKTQLSVIQEVFQNVHKELQDVEDVESEAFNDLDQQA